MARFSQGIKHSEGFSCNGCFNLYHPSTFEVFPHITLYFGLLSSFSYTETKERVIRNIKRCYNYNQTGFKMRQLSLHFKGWPTLYLWQLSQDIKKSATPVFVPVPGIHTPSMKRKTSANIWQWDLAPPALLTGPSNQAPNWLHWFGIRL